MAGCGSGSDADRYPAVTVVAATGPHGFSCEQTFDLFEHALELFDDTGVFVVVDKKICRTNPFNITAETWESAQGLWTVEYSRYPGKRIMVITNPVVTASGHFGQFGMCSTSGGVAVSTAMPIDEFGNDKYVSSLRLVIHELAHLFGATHDFTSNNFMGNGGPGEFVGWSDQTLMELEKWKS